MARKTYEIEAARLSKAIDIALESVKKYPIPGCNETQKQVVINGYENFKYLVENPEPPYRYISSLKQLESDAFTLFQEASGEGIDYFWKRIAEEKLGYIRENKLKKILQRGKIRGRVEYDYITDIVLVAHQQAQISKEEITTLYEMLRTYEKTQN